MFGSPRKSSRIQRKMRVNVERLEPRLLLAADMPLNDSVLLGQSTMQPEPSEVNRGGMEVNLGPMQILPGDTAVVPAEGHQMDADIVRGGSQYLSVWSDYRSSPDGFPPFETEGFGGDVYGRILDGNGSPIGSTPIIINQDFGDQISPTAAWNGESWLVVWKTETATLPTYEKVMAARVAADGTVLDETPIEVQNNQSYYEFTDPFQVASDGNDWVVMVQGSGLVEGVRAIRVMADGTVPDAGTLIHQTYFDTDFEVAFAQDRYLVTWTDPFAMPPRGRFYSSDLQPMGSMFFLSGADEITTDGTNFFLTWTAQGPGAWQTLKGEIIENDGTRPNPQGFDISSEPNICCSDVVWDGTHYWATWGGLKVARVTTGGTVLDPGGVTVGSVGQFSVPLRLDAAVDGGLQLVWNDGENGAVFPKDVYTTSVSPAIQISGDQLLSSGAAAQLNPDFAEGPGMFAIAFESRESGYTNIKVQRLDEHGVALDAEPIQVAGGPNVSGPGVAYDGTQYLITWRDEFSLYAQRMSTDGTLLDQPFEVMTTWDNPDVAGLNGTFLVVGTDYLSNDDNSRVAFTRRVDGATGALLDAQPQELGNFVIFSRQPRVVTFGDRWLVTWQTNLSHNNTIAGTKGAFVDMDGTSPGPFTVGLGWDPDVAVSGDRALFVAVSETISSANADIEGHIMMADGTFPNPPFTISDAPEKQLDPTATFDGENFVVAWKDKRDAVIYFDERTDIYGTKVSPEGQVLDFDDNGDGGIVLTTTPQPEQDVTLVTSGGTTLLATSTFVDERDLEAFRVAVAAIDQAMVGDFNGDQAVNATDIDLLFAEIRSGQNSPGFDLTGDGQVDSLDADELVLNILGTLYADANLDGVVDGLDFIQWNEHRFQPGGWSQGDFNGDAIVDGSDFIVWNENRFQSAIGVDDSIASLARMTSDAESNMAPTPERVCRLTTPNAWKRNSIQNAEVRPTSRQMSVEQLKTMDDGEPIWAAKWAIR